ncbi:pyruvate dehydrogenase (acetyl-transferring) E1 component subunit alpha [Actinomadura nitritigenes]|uniref:Pyruvate dehydrogenase E1 component subunit alpha n=1 Tax=Actinomadura nitritigenes TaxID=134602 RepID=A0ABS3QV19_9ACTN|nr:pyruvate dehydrogenase (acetyl-transferring) E1 component subunit alpha [Actinomadura nitritigenes]MBO2437824.1 pyruvate dehydrogenase (acetyl-transferring) E1 component subunit alpha [Actinomadura nitritigenes]
MTRTRTGRAGTAKAASSRRARSEAESARDARAQDASAQHASAHDAVVERHRGLLREMLRIRRFEERCVELYSSSDIRGFVHLYIGEEAVAAGVMPVLAPDDAVVSTYREHGHALARGVPADAIMAEMFGRSTGCSRGRGGSMHLFDARTRFYGGNAIVGGGLPLAVGLALADRMRGADRVTACFFGDGAVAEGEFHECLNLAALWHLPVLFICENNRYAMGTSLPREHAQTDLALRASSYGMVSWAADGMDVLAVSAAAQRAVEAVRWGGGPHFLELRTYRYRAHSMYDPDRYRDKAEIQEWKRHDPIDALAARMRADDGLTDGDLAAMEEEIATELSGAVDAARAAPSEPIEDLTRFVYSEQEVRP